MKPQPETLQVRIGYWAVREGIQETIQGRIAHIKKEIAELEESERLYEDLDEGFSDLEKLRKSFESEAADLGILLFGYAHQRGFDLLTAMEEKFSEVRARRWSKPDAEGVIEHVREGEADQADMMMGGSYELTQFENIKLQEAFETVTERAKVMPPDAQSDIAELTNRGLVSKEEAERRFFVADELPQSIKAIRQEMLKRLKVRPYTATDIETSFQRLWDAESNKENHDRCEEIQQRFFNTLLGLYDPAVGKFVGQDPQTEKEGGEA